MKWLCFSFISRSLAPWDGFFHVRTSFPSPPLSFEWCSRSSTSVINISDSTEMFCWGAYWMLFLFLQTFLPFNTLLEGSHGTSVMVQSLHEARCGQSLIFFKLDSSLPVLTDFYYFTILKERAALIAVVSWDGHVGWLQLKQKGEAEYWRVQGQVLKCPNKIIITLSYVWSFNMWTCNTSKLRSALVTVETLGQFWFLAQVSGVISAGRLEL